MGALPVIAPRLIMSSAQKNASSLVRIYSGATGAGGLTSLSLPSTRGKPLPILLYAQAGDELHDMAPKSNAIYIFEFFAAIATVFQLRDELWGRNVILSLDDEAVCAATTTGAANKKGSFHACLYATGQVRRPQANRGAAVSISTAPEYSRQIAAQPLDLVVR